MLEFLKREIDFFINLWNTTVPTILAMKPYIDKAMELPIFKLISICGSITGSIYLFSKIPKLLRKFREWGRF